jgi:CYTH domain-containing protein
MSVSLKYAIVERERRYLVASLPEGVTSTQEIIDRYVSGTRLRLREIRESDGTVTRKLGHKVRLSEGPAEVACTNLYLDDDEWAALLVLPARLLRKRRHTVQRDAVLMVVDEHEDGTLVAEIDDGGQPPGSVPDWLEVLADVSNDEAWTGARLAGSREVADRSTARAELRSVPGVPRR